MTLEYNDGKQERVGVAGVHGPFDPNNTSRIEELNAKFEGGAEKITTPDGVLNINGMGTAFRDADGTYVCMSIVAGDIWVSRTKPLLISEITNQRTGETEAVPNPKYERAWTNSITGAEREKIIGRFGGLEAAKRLIGQVESTEATALDAVERMVIDKEAKEKKFKSIKDNMGRVLINEREDDIKRWASEWKNSGLTDEQFIEAARYVYEQALLRGQSERVSRNGEFVGNTTQTGRLLETARFVGQAFTSEVKRLYDEQYKKWQGRG